MSDYREEIYHIFNSKGEIRQLENTLEAVNLSNQIVAVSSDEFIVCCSKNYPKDLLQESEITTIRKISDNIYMQITGIPSDINYIVKEAIDLAVEKTYQYNCVLTPDIFTGCLADKMQKYIQRSNSRIPAFSAVLFGLLDDKTVLYYTDSTSVDYQCYANASGKDYLKVTSFLEKNYKHDAILDDLIKLAIASLLQSIGREAESNEINTYIFSKNGLVTLSTAEIGNYLQMVAEEY